MEPISCKFPKLLLIQWTIIRIWLAWFLKVLDVKFQLTWNQLTCILIRFAKRRKLNLVISMLCVFTPTSFHNIKSLNLLIKNCLKYWLLIERQKIRKPNKNCPDTKFLTFLQENLVPVKWEVIESKILYFGCLIGHRDLKFKVKIL